VKPYYWKSGTPGSGDKVYMYEKTAFDNLFKTP